MNISKTKVIKLAAVFFIVFIISTIYLWSIIYTQKTVPTHDLLISSGSSSFTIALQLEHSGIITSARTFRWLARITGDDAALKSGLYRFNGQLNMLDVLKILKDGSLQQFKITIPEGLRIDEMLLLLAKATEVPLPTWRHALDQITHGDESEGMFLPETYIYSKPVNPYTILKQMFDARANIEATLRKEMGWSAAQIERNRTIASIVEKETALPHERVWVSAVIHNRIRLGMRLQMDPTVIYGLYRSQGSFSGNLRRKDLKTDSPWNTYTRRGLPISPICNPGENSLRAAAYPANVEYLYFVANGTGGHAFASTLKEHNENVKKWIKIERKANHPS